MEFDREKYNVYTWKNWMILHWILNPGLVINELIVGQRVPKVSLEEKSNKPRVERSRIPCPHCNTLHDGRTWSTHNGTAFKNWFGLYCPTCGNIIPCLINVFSFIILALTYPIWGWFKNSLKAQWLKKQPKRFENRNLERIPNPFDKKTWPITGLTFGAIMFVVMSLVYPYLTGVEITWETLLSGAIIWAIGGLTFGYVMKIYMGKSFQKKETKSRANSH